MTVRSGDNLSEDVYVDRSREDSASERAVQALIAIAEPFLGMSRDLVERQRSSAGILLPSMHARGAGEDDWEADFGEASELPLRELGVGVGNPNDVFSHLESLTPDGGPGTGERLLANQDRTFL